MPERKPPQSELSVLFAKAKRIEAEMNALKYNHRPTAPVYDFDALPQDAVEGQHALTTDGCYAWYQGGMWHEVCADEGDPLVSLPAYTIVANQVSDAQLVVPAGSNTDENVTLIANIPNNWIVFGFVSIGSVTRTEGGRKYYLPTAPVNGVFGGLTSFVANPGFAPIWVQRIGVGPAVGDQFDGIVNISGDNSGPILSAMEWGRNETGSTLVAGTNVLVSRYTPGPDGGPNLILGPRAYIFVAFNPTVLTLNANQPGFIFQRGLMGRGYSSDIFIRAINLNLVGSPAQGQDYMNIFGVVTRATTDTLNFSSSRVTKIASAHAGTTGAGYTDKIEHWLYVCARGVAGGLLSNTAGRKVDIRIPFTNRYATVPWVVSGLANRLTTTTPL